MVTRREENPESSGRRRKPAATPEAREHELINLAVDLAEKQLRRGTASSQVISHYLKLGSTRERLEQLRLEKENALLDVKTNAIASQERMEAIYTKALDAMRTYSGQEVPQDSGNFDD